MLDGHITKNNYEHENMVAAAVITDTHETSEWTALNWNSTMSIMEKQ